MRNYLPWQTWLICLCFCLPVVTQASDLIRVLPVTNTILMVHYDDGHIDYSGYRESENDNVLYNYPLNISAAMNLSNYTIRSSNDGNYSGGGQNPVNIGRKAKGTDFHKPDNWGASVEDQWLQETWVYIELPNALQRGKTYTISLNGIAINKSTYTFTYDEAKLRSETVHVSQLGFTPNSPKFAYLSQWMGDFSTATHQDGGLELESHSGATFYIVPAKNLDINAAVYSGPISKRKDKSTTETSHADFGPTYNFSHADVWECDFSGLTSPGEYVVVVEGIGRSYSFEIDTDVYRSAYYTVSKGLFSMRQGVDKEIAPGIIWPRDHHPDDLLHYYDANYTSTGHLNRGGSPEVGKPQVYGIWGYYHDASDWDRYIGHDRTAMVMLMLYDLKPENFRDGDINNSYRSNGPDRHWIEEGANGIPDILDEARWTIEFHMRGQQALAAQGLGTGGVPGQYMGREGGGGSGPAWEDTADAWLVSAESSNSSLNAAGLAAWYAYLIKELGRPSTEYQPYVDWAIGQYNWAKNKGGYDGASLAFAGVSLYRFTEQTSYQTDYVNNFGSTGNHIKDIAEIWEQSAGIFAMLPSNFPGLNTSEQNGRTRNKILSAANDFADPITSRGFRLGLSNSRKYATGSHSTPRVQIAAIAYEITGDQKYMDAIHTTCAYTLGGNESNTSFITQFGDNPEKFVHSINSWHTPEWDYNSMVYTNPTVQGMISYFGNTVSWVPNQGIGAEVWSQESLYPQPFNGSWPKGEGRIQNRNSIAGSEYTSPQTIIQGLFSYGYLCGANPNGAFTPNQPPTVTLNLSDSLSFDESSTVTLTASTSSDTRKVTYHYNAHFIGESFDAAGNFAVQWNIAESDLIIGDNPLITAVAYDDKGLISVPSDGGDKTINITGNVVEATGVSVSPSSLTLELGHSGSFTATIAPSNATFKNVTWSSSDPNTVSVDVNGNVTALKVGNASISATTHNDIAASADVTVNLPPVDMFVDAANAVPTIDGNGNEAMWSGLPWISIDQLHIDEVTGTEDQLPGAADFTGRYKVSWSPAAVYILAEITDDVLTYAPYDAEGFPSQVFGQDAFEIFIDENASGGEHRKSHNAFAYHLSPNGSVADQCGDNCADWNGRLFNNNVDHAWTQNGNIYTWEIAVSVYNDTYVDGGSNSGALVTLEANKVMGLGVAYNDVDVAGAGREHMIASFSVSGTTNTERNKAWMDADVFPIVALAEGTTPTVSVTGVSLTPATLVLEKGQTSQLSETVSPSNATDKAVSWNSSNASVATVDASGLVTAVAEGTATITVTTIDGSFQKNTTVDVPALSTGSTVVVEAENYDAMSGIQTQSTSDVGGGQNVGWLDNGDWMEYIVNFPTSGTYTTEYRLASQSNGASFDVSIDGSVAEGISSGATGGWQNWETVTGSVTVTSAGSKTVRITATGGGWNINWFSFTGGGSSNVPVSGVSVSSSNLTLDEGQTGQLSETVFPSDATDKAVSWSSSNNSVAIVNGSGLVTAIAAGSATITVTTNDGYFTANTSVTVNQPSQGQTYTLNPVADSYVRSGEVVNYGSDSRVMVHQMSWGENWEGFFKFDLSGVSGTITSAKLRLNQFINGVTVTHEVGLMTDDSWTEGGITYPNRPTSVANNLGSINITNTGWFESNLDASAINNHGDNIVTIRVSEQTTTGANVRYRSKEASQKPELIIETGSGARVAQNVSVTGDLFLVYPNPSFLVYPNPSAGSINIVFQGKATVSVFTMEGRLVQSTTAENRAIVDGLLEGVYLVRVSTPGGGINTSSLVIVE